MKIDVEFFTEKLAAEIAPLGQALWDECSEIKQETCSFHGERGFRIQPNIEQYLAINEAGSLLVLTLRDEAGVLQGYAIAILYRSLHHKVVQCANVDSFYVAPAYRAVAAVLIAKLEDQFRNLGVVVVGWPTSPEGPLCAVLKTLGYAPDDVLMEKRICALQQP